MKYLKYFESNSEIDSICGEYRIKNYTINPDGTVDVNGDVNLYEKGLTKLPLKFGYVSGEFDCSYNQLTSLEGSPKKVGGGFYCGYNKLVTLEGAPKEVGGYFDCRYNQLTSLVGAPEEVMYFNCSNNQLTSLEGAPMEVGGYFHCDGNPLPKEILDNMDYIDKIIKYQNDYNIWRRDGTLDKYRFSDMMIEIMEEEASK